MGVLAKAILCFLLIHLSLSSGSGYKQGNEDNVEGGGMMVRIDRRLGRGGGGGGSSGGGRSSSPSGSGAASKKTPNTSTGNNKKNNNGGGTAPRRVPVTGPRRVPVNGGIYGAGAAASYNSNNNNHHSVGMAAPLGCKRNKFSLLAAAIVAILLAAEF